MKVLIVVATNFEITSDMLKVYPVLVTGIGMVNTSINLTRELSKNRYDLVINMGIAVDCIPTPSPAIIFVAGPVTDCFTMEFTGGVPVPV